ANPCTRRNDGWRPWPSQRFTWRATSPTLACSEITSPIRMTRWRQRVVEGGEADAGVVELLERGCGVAVGSRHHHPRTGFATRQRGNGEDHGTGVPCVDVVEPAHHDGARACPQAPFQ